MALSSRKSTALEWYTRLVLVISGLIIATPGVIGAISIDGLHDLYAVGLHTTTETVLLQHRGVLLVIIGGLLLTSSMVRSLRLAAIVAGLFSNIAFITLTLLQPDTHANLGPIAWVDVALTLLLVPACIIQVARCRDHKV